MRTVIFVGLMKMAEYINPDKKMSEFDKNFFGTIFLVAVVMDIISFFRGTP